MQTTRWMSLDRKGAEKNVRRKERERGKTAPSSHEPASLPPSLVPSFSQGSRSVFSPMLKVHSSTESLISGEDSGAFGRETANPKTRYVGFFESIWSRRGPAGGQYRENRDLTNPECPTITDSVSPVRENTKTSEIMKREEEPEEEQVLVHISRYSGPASTSHEVKMRLIGNARYSWFDVTLKGFGLFRKMGSDVFRHKFEDLMIHFIIIEVSRDHFQPLLHERCHTTKNRRIFIDFSSHLTVQITD